MIIPINVFSQEVISISVLVKGKVVGKTTFYDDPAEVSIKKNAYRTASSATCVVKQSNRNDVFKHSLEVTDSSERSLMVVKESSKKNNYIVNLSALRKKIIYLNMINIFFREDPANDMMAVRSSRVLLARIYFKR